MNWPKETIKNECTHPTYFPHLSSLALNPFNQCVLRTLRTLLNPRSIQPISKRILKRYRTSEAFSQSHYDFTIKKGNNWLVNLNSGNIQSFAKRRAEICWKCRLVCSTDDATNSSHWTFAPETDTYRDTYRLLVTCDTWHSSCRKHVINSK